MLLDGIGISSADMVAKVPLEMKRKTDWEQELELEKETVAFTNSIGTKVADKSAATISSTSSIAQDAKKAKLAAVASKPVPGVKSITSFFSSAAKK